ncbi:MAG: oligopeptidase A [Candidatus Competibacteraceae bacterium]|jgi:oligopeptidase A|nr:oligopeptidase A [Candidatus Competibacteraceae bacterium]
MSNPLLNSTPLPTFSTIRAEHVEPAIDQLLADNRTRLEDLLNGGTPYTWNNLIRPLEDMEDQLNRAWSPVSHLNAVMNSEELRAAYNACLPKLSAYYTDLGQNEQLYQAYQAIADGPDYARFDQAQQTVIDHALRDFRLSGVALTPDKKERFKTIMQSLSQLQSKFQDNVLDATQAWKKPILDEADLAGLPESAKSLAQQTAQRQELEGWLLTLELPSYLPVMNYADSRELRQEMYHAYVTRASEQGPHAGQWDNSPIMEEILQLRHEVAQLLEFADYTEYSLAAKMAQSPGQVLEFLNDLARRSRPQAQQELEEIKTYAAQMDDLDELQAWDVGYYAEKLRQHRYQISQEELRPYFPETKVVPGLFAVVERLYGLNIRPVDDVEIWHPDVRAYEILDSDGNRRGLFYFDLYAHPSKRGGAWMHGCVSRRQTSQGLQIPAAYMVCNFTPPVGERSALFTHDEVTTLFHEFGHGLHHLLTQVDYSPVSGIHGVEWDAVELPSQFMENWCWEREALDLIAGHFETGKPIPDVLYQRMIAAKNFQSAMQMVRQLEFALFDFRVHHEYDPAQGGRVLAILDEVRQQVAVIMPPPFNRFTHGFSHIFAGGYAAGYYSYKWAEVLSADAFSKFEENGIFDRATGAQFLQSVLEVGGSRDAMTNFVEFRGREPRIDPLLRHNGIAA